MGSTSGAMGNMQLLAWVNEASGDAVRVAAKELGFVHVAVEVGGVEDAALAFATKASPEILLVEIGGADSAPGQLDMLADVLNPHTKVLCTGTVDSIRFYQWLSDLGIEGYLLQPFTAAELKAAIAKGAIKKPEQGTSAKPDAKKTIAVIGARGGVGTTTIATNLAAIFAKEHGVSTAIIDLDPYFGSVALGLDLEPSRGLRDAFEKPDRVDALFLERVMVKPFVPLSILSAEEPLSDPITIQPNAGEMVLAALKEKFGMIVVDVPRQMNPLTRHVLAHADHVIIIAEPQLTSLRDALRVKDYLVDTLKRPAPMLVLNRVGVSPKSELSAKEFAKNYAAELTAQLPHLPEAMAATAQGELLISNGKLASQLAPLRAVARTLGGTLTKPKEKSAAADARKPRFMGKK